MLKIDKYGNREWYNKSGKRHREDGPAVEMNSGGKYWYLNGTYYTEEEYNNVKSSILSKNILYQ